MKDKWKIILGIIGTLLLSIALCSIGFMSIMKSKTDYNASSVNDSFNEVSDTELSFKSEGVSEESASSKDIFVSNEDENQKLVYSGRTSISTEDIKKTYSELTDSFGKYDAKLESLDESSTYKSLIIRVPKDNFMDFYNSLSTVSGRITSSNISINDMTKTYVDNERRIKTLEDEYKALSELMSKASTVEDVLTIRSKMSEVSYELESIKNNNNSIDYDANFSRLEVYISLVGSSSDVGDSFWHQLKEAFENSIEIFRYLILGIVSVWWILLIVIGAIFGIIKRKELQKIIKNKKERK